MWSGRLTVASRVNRRPVKLRIVADVGWTEIVVTAGLGVVASVVIAFVTARLTARQELRGWRREFA